MLCNVPLHAKKASELAKDYGKMIRTFITVEGEGQRVRLEDLDLVLRGCVSGRRVSLEIPPPEVLVTLGAPIRAPGARLRTGTEYGRTLMMIAGLGRSLQARAKA